STSRPLRGLVRRRKATATCWAASRRATRRHSSCCTGAMRGRCTGSRCACSATAAARRTPSRRPSPRSGARPATTGPSAGPARRGPPDSARYGQDPHGQRARPARRPPGGGAEVTKVPEFDELIGADAPAEERERLRRVHELLVAAGPPAELPPSLETVPEPEPQVTLLPQRRRLTVI